ncbi:fumarylacetoacetate hydrolase family protein [Embleya sp. NPDC056575]|uniref:fumarylacetoacetate hydrolase family protein n=1 Tax=unclassified Embleya TaxID=2699296 RepID=UPI0036D1D875
MRIARFSTDDSVSFGVVTGDADRPESLVVHALAGHPFGELRPTGAQHALSSVRLLAPVLPSKVVAIGKNYAAHAAEMGGAIPDAPITFLKPSTSVIGHGDGIAYPQISDEVHHEAELAVVVGRMCRDVPAERVAEVIFGFTCANDVTARDLQRTEGQWGRAKGMDTFCPLGPWVETDITLDQVTEGEGLTVACTVNGEVRQAGSTGQMIRTVTELIVHVTQAMTLLPGDVLLTGTPAGVGPLHVGDRVSVTVGGVGTLTNTVVKRG